MPKQAIPFLLEVGFDIDLDEVEKVEFVFTQSQTENAPTIKSALWVNGNENETAFRDGENDTIEIPWSREETFKFQRDATFYMDTRIKYVGGSYCPQTPIIALKMSPSLFKQGEVVTNG